MLAITMKTDPAQGKSNMFHCPIFQIFEPLAVGFNLFRSTSVHIFCLVFPRSRQKPFARRSSLQAYFLLLLLLSLSGWGCVKCALYFLPLITTKPHQICFIVLYSLWSFPDLVKNLLSEEALCKPTFYSFCYCHWHAGAGTIFSSTNSRKSCL